MKGTCLQLFYVKFYILLYFYFTIYKQKTNNIFIKCNYDFSWSNNDLIYVETFLL